MKLTKRKTKMKKPIKKLRVTSKTFVTVGEVRRAIKKAAAEKNPKAEESEIDCCIKCGAWIASIISKYL